MASQSLADALRVALEVLVKQRQAAGEDLRMKRSALNQAGHLLEKAKESERIAIRDADNASANFQALIDLSNSKLPEERSVFQGAIAHLEQAQSTAIKTRDARAKIVSEQELTYHYAQLGLKESEEKLANIESQVASLEKELNQALQ